MDLSIVTTLYIFYSAPRLEEFYARACTVAGEITNNFEIIWLMMVLWMSHWTSRFPTSDGITGLRSKGWDSYDMDQAGLDLRSKRAPVLE